MRCGQLKLKYIISFSFNHICCFKCLIRVLTLSQFKNCDNSSIIFICSRNTRIVSFSFKELFDELTNDITLDESLEDSFLLFALV